MLRQKRVFTQAPPLQRGPHGLDRAPGFAVWALIDRFLARSLAPMPIELKMPALSPTMEEGTLAKWLVKEGDTVAAGDLLAEIETDKATMEFEAVDEGTIAKILVAEGTDEVKVGTVIAIIAAEGEDAGAAASAPTTAKEPVEKGGGETGAGQPATPTPAPDVKGYGANPAEDAQIAAAT